ncbi:MAG TPA: type IV secretion system protein [Candidatus Tectomicrobia bacterium]
MTEPTDRTYAPAASNGHALPMDWQGVPDDVIARMELAYQEIQRRDSQAEQRAWRKDRLVQRLGLVIVALAGVLVWMTVTKHQVQAFVQTVQVTDAGQLVQLGVPQDLYAYSPPEGVYMEMVAQWVRWTRWRGDDERMTRVQWAWAYRHTCGIANKWLKALEEKEKPFRIGSKRVSVDIKSVTKLAAPDSYQVLWEEHLTEKNAPTVKSQLWTGAFTVGRTKLTTMDDLLDNRLGVCVTAYDVSPQG